MTPPKDPLAVPPDLVALQRFSKVMDSAIRLPILGVEVGLDALLGLVPGAGDVLGAVLGLGAVVAGLRHRVPMGVLLRLVGNLLLDLGLGTVPVVGDVADMLFRANRRNVALVLEHRDASQPPRPLWGMVAVVLVPAGVVLTGVTMVMAAVLTWAWAALGSLWGAM
jgi:hypothetical protein